MSKRPAQMMAVCVTLALGSLATACSSSSESSPTTSGSSSTTAAVNNLTATAAVKAELLAAGAVYNKLTSADYAGLAPGLTYLALDNPTGTKWAGVSLQPSTSSQQAQVSSQDAGAYMILAQAPGQSWKVMALTGGGSTCSANVPPASVMAAWGWKSGTCAAPNA